jgi:hypothetical protein
VLTKALLGDYFLNPYGLYRRWTVKKDLSSTNPAAEIRNSYLNDDVANLRNEMRQNYHNIIEQLRANQQTASTAQPVADTSAATSAARGARGASKKGKAPARGRSRAKNLNLRPYVPVERPNNEEDFMTNDSSSEGSFRSARRDVVSGARQAPVSGARQAPLNLQTEEEIFLRSLSLEINSDPLDQVITYF